MEATKKSASKKSARKPGKTRAAAAAGSSEATSSAFGKLKHGADFTHEGALHRKQSDGEAVNVQSGTVHNFHEAHEVTLCGAETQS